ncbi:hypothetical protein Ndes2526B_g07356 [Nannochloris sp. 'desiccata']|nr:hypothetical protein KSW81_004631 [Chlorella desiccata (nom. nud.)]KAH7618416.1 putative Nucleoside diphosphate kinase 2, chloroplastic [Chlorella desiccata (nom. nud.)]
MATQMIASQRPTISGARMASASSATQMVCPRATAPVAVPAIKSTSFISGASALRTAQTAKLAVKCRSAAATVIRSEISYVMIKPDGVQRGLVGEVISRFERKGFQLRALKLFQTPRDIAEEHYKDLSSKPFFGALVDYILSGPVVCMVWEGDGVIKSARKIIGATNPLEAEPGTIRGDFAIMVGRNVVHGSDSPENGERETALWFGNDALVAYDRAITPWLIEERD